MSNRFNRILREGFVGGCIGAAAVATWFLLVDTIGGRPFFTPAMLGSAVFFGPLVIHGSDANRSERDRRAVTIAYNVTGNNPKQCREVLRGRTARSESSEKST